MPTWIGLDAMYRRRARGVLASQSRTIDDFGMEHAMELPRDEALHILVRLPHMYECRVLMTNEGVIAYTGGWTTTVAWMLETADTMGMFGLATRVSISLHISPLVGLRLMNHTRQLRQSTMAARA